MAKPEAKADPLDEIEISAAESIISAIEDGDAAALRSALVDLIRSGIVREHEAIADRSMGRMGEDDED